MLEPLIVIEESGTLAARLAPAHPVAAGSAKQFHAAFEKYAAALFVARPTPVLKWLGALDFVVKKSHSLLLLGQAKAPERTLLNALFKNVVVANDDFKMLDIDDLIDVVQSPKRASLFIGGAAVPAAKSVVLVRGNLHSLVIPFSWFTHRPSAKPDFSDFEVVDCGQTIRLGKYEASADVVLYEFDAEFRKQEKKRRTSEDKSLGGALRRLRLQRGLRRDEFPGIDPKTIARIERGDVKKPHEGTLALIAERLGVKPEEIASY